MLLRLTSTLRSFKLRNQQQGHKLAPWTLSLPTPTSSLLLPSSSLVSDLKLTRYHLGRLWSMLASSFDKKKSLFYDLKPYNERMCLKWPDSMTVHISTEDLHEFFEAITSPTCATVCANVSANLQQVHLGHGARRVLTAPTGGRTSQSSVMSEALSVELLSRLLGSDLTKTETELTYTSEGPMTDYACQIQDTQLGVSVTRAMSYWGNYTKEDAVKLLTRKLNGILRSSERIVNASFDKQILHVLTMSGRDAAMVKRACRRLSQDLKSDTVILITTLNTESVFFNSNQSLAKKQIQLK